MNQILKVVAIPAAVVGAALLSLCVQSKAQPKPQCGPVDQLLTAAQERFEESIAWGGVMQDGSALLLVHSPTGSWGLFRVQGSTACVLASGEGGNFTAVGRES